MEVSGCYWLLLPGNTSPCGLYELAGMQMQDFPVNDYYTHMPPAEDFCAWSTSCILAQAFKGCNWF